MVTNKAASAADIVWSAAIDDLTGRFFVTFNSNLNKTYLRGQKTFQGISSQSRSAALAIGVAAGAVSAVTTALIRMGTAAIREFKEVITESIQLAARADTLAVALGVVAANAGYASGEIDSYVEGLREANIDQIAAREILLQMVQAQLDLSKSTELANVAKDAAIISDTNSSEALRRIIHGITTLNPLVLNRLRLLVDLDGATRDYANANNIAVESISKATKVSILLNLVLEAGSNIAGAYDAAMDTAGKRARSLERVMKDLQIAMGGPFQEAYLQWILFLEDILGRTAALFKDNADAAERFGHRLGAAVELGLKSIKEMVEVLGEIGDTLGGVGEISWGLLSALPVSVVGAIVGLDEARKRLETFEETVQQTMAILITGFLLGTKVVADFALTVVDSVAGATAALLGMEEAEQAAIDRITERIGGGEGFEGYIADLRVWAAETMILAGEMTGALEDAGDGDELDPLIDQAGLLASEMDKAAAAIKRLADKIKKEMAEVAIDMMRANIEEEINLSRRIEDIARGNLRRIIDIWENFAYRRGQLMEDLSDEEKELEEERADKRGKLAKDHARDLIDVEVDYQRELEDIKRDFWDTATEAARKNDAVAVARAMRDAAKGRRDAAIERDRDVVDAKVDYVRELEDLKEAQDKRKKELKKDRDERLKDLEEDLIRQLDMADKAHVRQLEDLNLYLKRRQEDITRHNEWDRQDRQRKWDLELREMGTTFANMEYLEEQHLLALVAKHEEFYERDLALWTAYAAARAGILGGGGEAGGSGAGGPGWGLGIDIDPMLRGGEEGGSGSGGPGWGFAAGGMGLATTPTNITVGEVPELFAAIPLNAMTQHNIHMSGGMSISGVSPEMEQNLMPQMMGMMNEFAAKLMSGRVQP